jgi:hypothetical protein
MDEFIQELLNPSSWLTVYIWYAIIIIAVGAGTIIGQVFHAI